MRLLDAEIRRALMRALDRTGEGERCAAKMTGRHRVLHWSAWMEKRAKRMEQTSASGPPAALSLSSQTAGPSQFV